MRKKRADLAILVSKAGSDFLAPEDYRLIKAAAALEGKKIWAWVMECAVLQARQKLGKALDGGKK